MAGTGACACCADDAALSFGTAKMRAIDRFERAYLTALLRLTDGNVSKAARKADMDRMHLHRMITRYGIDVASFRKET